MSNSIYDVWCDGSYRDGKTGPASGAGWVVKKDGISRTGFETLPKLTRDERPYGSDIAELQAFKLALAATDIPPGSNIRVRMDCQHVIDILQSGRLQTKKPIPALLAAFEGAHEIAQSMGKIEYIKASDRNNENMKKANELARTASSPTLSAK